MGIERTCARDMPETDIEDFRYRPTSHMPIRADDYVRAIATTKGEERFTEQNGKCAIKKIIDRYKNHPKSAESSRFFIQRCEVCNKTAAVRMVNINSKKTGLSGSQKE